MAGLCQLLHYIIVNVLGYVSGDWFVLFALGFVNVLQQVSDDWFVSVTTLHYCECTVRGTHSYYHTAVGL